MTGRPERDSDDTVDPNRGAVWPTYPPGTRVRAPKYGRVGGIVLNLIVGVLTVALIAFIVLVFVFH